MPVIAVSFYICRVLNFIVTCLLIRKTKIYVLIHFHCRSVSFISKIMRENSIHNIFNDLFIFKKNFILFCI